MAQPLRILVVDDDPVMRELLDALLGIAGHVVTTLDSGDGAVSLLETQRFDAVLTDLHMPGLQGKELAARLLKDRAPGTLLVGMSGSFPSEEEKRQLDCFLQKPFTPEQFNAAIEAARRRTTQPPALSPRTPSTPVILDDEVFLRLRETLPADSLEGLYQLTLGDVHERVTRIRAAGALQDTETVRTEAHAIKGGSGMVGASEIYHLATELERHPDAWEIPLTKMELACTRLKGMLDSRLRTER
ncbi:MAG: response regulator [Acidobacteriaceae bacterium]|nr:response regulator [Acidobacteriaceae bacterium]